jgi:acyl-CoA thioesterase-1
MLFEPRRVLLAYLAGVCLLLLSAAACGGSGGGSASTTATPPQPAPQAPRTEDQRPKVVLLGDSLTAGLGLVETQSYPGLLQQKMEQDGFDFEVVNAGVSGDTSAGGLRRLDWILQEDVRVLVVALGANDGLRGLPVNEMKQNLGQIIETARARNIVVVLAGMEAPPNYGSEYASSFRQAFRDIAQKHRVVFIPFLLDKVAGEPALNQPDGIHPNARGAEIIAGTVWTVLKPLLDQISNS